MHKLGTPALVGAVLLLCLVWGCGARDDGGSVSLTLPTKLPNKAGYDLEVVTAKELTKQEVLAAKTAFEIDASKDSDAWNRAQIFMKSYRNETLPTDVTLSSKLVSAQTDSEFIYTIQKRRLGQVYMYDVTCQSDKHPSSEDADLNAKNLARFIADGTFEQSLWVR